MNRRGGVDLKTDQNQSVRIKPRITSLMDKEKQQQDRLIELSRDTTTFNASRLRLSKNRHHQSYQNIYHTQKKQGREKTPDANRYGQIKILRKFTKRYKDKQASKEI